MYLMIPHFTYSFHKHLQPNALWPEGRSKCYWLDTILFRHSFLLAQQELGSEAGSGGNLSSAPVPPAFPHAHEQNWNSIQSLRERAQNAINSSPCACCWEQKEKDKVYLLIPHLAIWAESMQKGESDTPLIQWEIFPW